MKKKSVFARGCLLGLAIGDGMGSAIDDLSWAAIRENYGPNGLLGFDLQEAEFAPVTSHTQIAAFVCNGLLIGLSRANGNYPRWCQAALQEWAHCQQTGGAPEGKLCFVASDPLFRRPVCRDLQMLDTLRTGDLGTLTHPKNRNNLPGAITAGIAAGLFFQPNRMEPPQVGTLAAELTALTHGDPETILSGVVLAYTIAGILQEPDQPLHRQFTQAIGVMEGQFGSRFAEAKHLALLLRRTVDLVRSGRLAPQEGMELLECRDAARCLAGAIFACLSSPDDFDSAIITAVNHSGRSAAVGAITGAVLGAKLGETALPDFYLESLECTNTLGVLAADLLCGTRARGLFDQAWDRKYEQGLPAES